MAKAKSNIEKLKEQGPYTVQSTDEKEKLDGSLNAEGERRVSPIDTVEVEFSELTDSDGNVIGKGRKEKIHPELARKLYKKGVLTYVDEDDKPEDQEEPVKKTAKAKAKNDEV